MADVYGEHWGLVVFLSFLVTWGIGLTPPLLIRFVFLQRPVGKGTAIGIVAMFLIVNLGVFSLLGSQSKTHSALVLVAFVSYAILRKAPKKQESEMLSAVLNDGNREASSFPPNGAPDIATSTTTPHLFVDENRFYAQVAEELAKSNLDKGLWTRLFAECGGDEKQTEVLYINQRAEYLLAAEHARLEQLAKEQTQRALSGLADPRLVSAVSDGNLDMARQLLEEGVKPTGFDEHGNSLLALARKQWDRLMIRLLESYGAR